MRNICLTVCLLASNAFAGDPGPCDFDCNSAKILVGFTLFIVDSGEPLATVTIDGDGNETVYTPGGAIAGPDYGPVLVFEHTEIGMLIHFGADAPPMGLPDGVVCCNNVGQESTVFWPDGTETFTAPDHGFGHKDPASLGLVTVEAETTWCASIFDDPSDCRPEITVMGCSQCCCSNNIGCANPSWRLTEVVDPDANNDGIVDVIDLILVVCELHNTNCQGNEIDDIVNIILHWGQIVPLPSDCE